MTSGPSILIAVLKVASAASLYSNVLSTLSSATFLMTGVKSSSAAVGELGEPLRYHKPEIKDDITASKSGIDLANARELRAFSNCVMILFKADFDLSSSLIGAETQDGVKHLTSESNV